MVQFHVDDTYCSNAWKLYSGCWESGVVRPWDQRMDGVAYVVAQWDGSLSFFICLGSVATFTRAFSTLQGPKSLSALLHATREFWWISIWTWRHMLTKFALSAYVYIPEKYRQHLQLRCSRRKLYRDTDPCLHHQQIKLTVTHRCMACLSQSSANSNVYRTVLPESVIRTCKREHVTSVLYELNWTPVAQRTTFKVSPSPAKTYMELAPDDLNELVVPYRSMSTICSKDADLPCHSTLSATLLCWPQFCSCGPFPLELPAKKHSLLWHPSAVQNAA